MMKSVASLRKQLELQPTARLHQSLGDCLREINYRAEALEHYNKAMAYVFILSIYLYPYIKLKNPFLKIIAVSAMIV